LLFDAAKESLGATAKANSATAEAVAIFVNMDFSPSKVKQDCSLHGQDIALHDQTAIAVSQKIVVFKPINGRSCDH
jgi:hypothetical protein